VCVCVCVCVICSQVRMDITGMRVFVRQGVCARARAHVHVWVYVCEGA